MERVRVKKNFKKKIITYLLGYFFIDIEKYFLLIKIFLLTKLQEIQKYLKNKYFPSKQMEC